MVLSIYNIIIHLAYPFLQWGGRWNEKLRKRNQGLQSQKVQKLPKSIWIHTASLGEFEQGKPFIDLIRKRYPHMPLVLTFFSSSGYEKRSDYDQVDFVYYLPYDRKDDMTNFIHAIQPQIAVFVKYEFWFNTLQILKKNEIPYYFISASFRASQYLFNNWARPLLQQIAGAQWIFVQNENSQKLLNKHQISQVAVAGDTRIDRVMELAHSNFQHRQIKRFTQNSFTVIAGSTWPPDEKIIFQMTQVFPEWTWIVAPHEVDPAHIAAVRSLWGDQAMLLSEFNEESDAKVLIVDQIGILSRIYRYGNVAYIGGGFGAGIHNTLEPVAHRLPVIFGPKYEKFQEAVAFISLGIGQSVNNASDAEAAFQYYESSENQENIKQIIDRYLSQNAGASQRILNHIEGVLPWEN